MLWTIARCSAVGGAATLAGPCAFGKSAGLSEDGDVPGAASTSSCRSLGAAGGPSGSFDCGGRGLSRSSFLLALVSPLLLGPRALGGVGAAGPPGGGGPPPRGFERPPRPRRARAPQPP